MMEFPEYPEEEKILRKINSLNLNNTEEAQTLNESITLQQIDEILQYNPKTSTEQTKITEFLDTFNKQNAYPYNDPEMIKHINFIRWIKSHGSDIRSTKIVVYGKHYRGLHVTKNIKAGETIISIPITLAVSSLNVETTELGVKLMNLFDAKWRSYIFPLIYVLGESKKRDSAIKEWLAITPNSVDGHPMFFNEDEAKWLQASPILGIFVSNRNRTIADR